MIARQSPLAASWPMVLALRFSAACTAAVLLLKYRLMKARP
jgi:hypothetical protein